ncbi:MAG: hypothetical protein II257_03295, partial [Clostridia bacterium]|nr:hypothetical protein [Clostridia bacterium]
MAQNELQEMISRYQKELLQYARSANKPTASQSAVSQSTASQSVTKAPTAQTQPTAQTRPIPSQPRSPQFTQSPQTAPSFSAMQPPTPPLDEIDSGYMADEFDEMLPDELDDIEGLLENESDDFLPDELDRYSDEELSGYFSAYPEDADNQMPSPNTYADTQPTASQSVTKKATNRPQPTEPQPTAAARPNSVAAATETNFNPETEPEFVGFLEVTARTGDGAKPVEAALVIVSSTDEKGERLEFTALTDSSGTARLFNLPASNPANTESPDMPDRFILYNVSISKPGYFDMVSTGV